MTGALTFTQTAETGRLFTVDDLDVAMELGSRCAMLLEQVVAHRRTADARDRADGLQRFAAAMARAASVDAVVEAKFDLKRPSSSFHDPSKTRSFSSFQLDIRISSTHFSWPRTWNVKRELNSEVLPLLYDFALEFTFHVSRITCPFHVSVSRFTHHASVSRIRRPPVAGA